MIRLYTLLLTLFLFVGSVNANMEGTVANPNPVAFKMYPNPMTGDILQVNFDFEFKPGQVYSFVITNVIGQVVYTHTLSDDEVKKGSFAINIEQIKLDKGIYLTKMINGDHSFVQKLVVR
jgi:hypothetical protein